MLFIPPTLEPLLRKHQFSVVITMPDENKSADALLIRREALVSALRNTDIKKDIVLIDACCSVDGSNGHILFEYSPYRKRLNQKKIASILQNALIQINQKYGFYEASSKGFGDNPIEDIKVTQQFFPFTSIQFGMPPNLLELKKLPIAGWEESVEKT